MIIAQSIVFWAVLKDLSGTTICVFHFKVLKSSSLERLAIPICKAQLSRSFVFFSFSFMVRTDLKYLGKVSWGHYGLAVACWILIMFLFLGNTLAKYLIAHKQQTKSVDVDRQWCSKHRDHSVKQQTKNSFYLCSLALDILWPITISFQIASFLCDTFICT